MHLATNLGKYEMFGIQDYLELSMDNIIYEERQESLHPISSINHIYIKSFKNI